MRKQKSNLIFGQKNKNEKCSYNFGLYWNIIIFCNFGPIYEKDKNLPKILYFLLKFPAKKLLIFFLEKKSS